jgi:hypothetical protein
MCSGKAKVRCVGLLPHRQQSSQDRISAAVDQQQHNTHTSLPHAKLKRTADSSIRMECLVLLKYVASIIGQVPTSRIGGLHMHTAEPVGIIASRRSLVRTVGRCRLVTDGSKERDAYLRTPRRPGLEVMHTGMKRVVSPNGRREHMAKHKVRDNHSAGTNFAREST